TIGGKLKVTQLSTTGYLGQFDFCAIARMGNAEDVNRPGFPGECFICELRLPDHRFRWKHNKLFLLLPEEYGPAFPAIVDCYTSPPT
ncbi:type VI secretion system tube protein Hcp, partial [Salmonella enterica]|nr:type VI secretion system tube protein Hcp [Salmonella enterica]EDW8188713.1 type VI secretion system tube protein Hcp [Salmonella enterica subsp. enterica serovar Braenderup]